MAGLSDFSIRVNLHGWYVKKAGTFVEGEIIPGAAITERMVVALENEETFNLNGVIPTPVCVLHGGSVESLRAAMGAKTIKRTPKPVAKAAPAPAPVEEKPAPAPVAEEKKKPGRKPKPKTD